MALLQSDSVHYRDLDYAQSPPNKPINVGTNSPFDTYEFGHLQSPPFPHTSSYNGSYQNSPYSGNSELSYDPDGPDGFALFGDSLDVREDYDPSEYDPPNSSGLLVFDGEFISGLDHNTGHVSVSVTPAPIDQHSPRSYDHSSPSSNDDARPRSRASSVSSNPQILPHSSPHLDVAHNFEKLRFESPNWRHNQLPTERTLSPPRKAQSPPQLLIPDSSPALFPQEAPMINAPEGDGGFVSSGPQLHIVPATPVSGGGAASQAVPFQSTLETLHQGKFIDSSPRLFWELYSYLFYPCCVLPPYQALHRKMDHSNNQQHPHGINDKFNKPRSPNLSGYHNSTNRPHSFTPTATLLIGCPLLEPKYIPMVQIPTSSFQTSLLVRVASLTLHPRCVPSSGIHPL